MSGDSIQLRPSRPEDAERVLAFIRAMGFTPRDRTTWEALGMCAVLALRGEEVVGAIPIEVRPVKIAPDLTVQWAHQTCVAVHPDLRGGGLGSRLQKLLRSTLPSGTQMMGVYREDPDSPAYRWYVNNGFRKTMTVVSWTKELDAGDKDRRASAGLRVEEAWRLHRTNGCFVDQTQRSLAKWLEVHPYRSRYRLEIVEVRMGYAVLGIGQLHSESTRADVLDFVASEEDARELLEQCLARARELKARPLRWALSEHDPLVALAKQSGMTPGWRFDLLIQEIVPGLHFDVSSWRYASIDFA
jgi:GNAT superfamily N-acetyltransferase